MRALLVPLPDEAAEQLRRLARDELRTPRQQAAALIVDALRRVESRRRRRNGGAIDPREEAAQ